MALLFIEGFDNIEDANGIFPVVHSLYGKWDSVNAFFSGSGPRFEGGGKYMYITDRGQHMGRNIGQNLSEGCIGFAFIPVSSSSYTANLVVLFDGNLDTTVQMGVKLNNDLTMSIFRGSHSNILDTTTTALAVNQWSFIELKFKISSSIADGDVILYVNGANVLQLTAGNNTQATSNAYTTGYRLFGNVPTVSSPATGQVGYDDHYLIDFTGSRNNAPLGNCRVVTIRPNGNGNSSQFIGSDGNSTNNYEMVDDPNGTPDNDSTYVESDVVGNKDTYSMSDLPETINTIHGMQTSLYAKKTDTEERTINGVLRVNGADYDLTATGNLTSAYVNYRNIVEENPEDSSSLTPSVINDLEFGIKVAS